MKMKSEQLRGELIAWTHQHLNDAEALKQMPLDALRWKASEQQWNVLECIEHLNLYGDYYLPEIEKQISRSRYPAEEVFKSGLLGNYFAKTMLPREKLNKMKTFQDKNPLDSKLDRSVLDRFIDQQKQTLELLDQSRKVSLSRTKTGISISKWIRLRLGDTFRVVIYHNRRHMVQAEKALQAYKKSGKTAVLIK
ncbi:DinB family protein [Catalinimonas locisalis]|uniref:DinB family protein n=1 Tax=Catalinimonas locisalis TaxID=3133978 RepID=UPI0031016EF1